MLLWTILTFSLNLEGTFKNIFWEIQKIGRQIDRSQSDGRCFLHSLVTCLQKDHQVPYTLETLRNILTTHIRKSDIEFERLGTTKLAVLRDAENLFDHGVFNRNTVDIVVAECSKAIGADIYIYEEGENGNIVTLEFLGGHDGLVDIHLIFYRGLLGTVPHYDAITKCTTVHVQHKRKGKHFSSKSMYT